MNKEILMLLEKDARLSCEDIAAALDIPTKEVEREIADMESAGIIRAYRCVIDKDSVDIGCVTAMIELKVTPKAGRGFEYLAERIAKYPEVEYCALLSGVCDLIVTVRGRSFKEVSSFVANELAMIDGVSSTATQFVMKKYKELGVSLFGDDDDGRGRISL